MKLGDSYYLECKICTALIRTRPQLEEHINTQGHVDYNTINIIENDEIGDDI